MQELKGRWIPDIFFRMSQVNSITNSKRNITISSGGNCTDFHLIYTTQCTKHDLVYVGCTTKKLNKSFHSNKHDVRHNNATSTEFEEHFITNDYNFKDTLTYTFSKNIQNPPTFQLLKGMKMITYTNY